MGKTCKGITDAMSQYWWGDEDNQRRMHWFAWWKICIPKERGGMDFRDVHSFNLAMLAKQFQRLIENFGSLCARVLRARYYPNGDILNTVFPSDVSPVWRGIEQGLKLLKKGLIWRVGNGKSIQIQRDQWIPRVDGLKTAQFIRRSRLRWVNQLINQETKDWDRDLTGRNFLPL